MHLAIFSSEFCTPFTNFSKDFPLVTWSQNNCKTQLTHKLSGKRSKCKGMEGWMEKNEDGNDQGNIRPQLHGQKCINPMHSSKDLTYCVPQKVSKGTEAV